MRCGEQAIERGQVWERRGDGRWASVLGTSGGRVLLAVAAGHGGELVMLDERSLRAGFSFTGGWAVGARRVDGDRLPSPFEAAFLRAAGERPAAWLEEVLARAERDGCAQLAALARQALAFRGCERE